MPLSESYVIWNNKGGVGKSTLTFHMATQYATENPTKSVLVIDLCPQANLSMALLSSQAQHGSYHLSSLRLQKMTVCFYLQRSLDPRPMVNAEDFLTKVEDYNDQVPGNIFLLCGDMDLELVGRHLENVRGEDVLSSTNSWLNVTSSIRNFIEGSRGKIDGVTEGNADWVVFIDANPTLNVYTEIALAAAKKLLVPINADDFSVEAVRTMIDSVYGIRQGDKETSEAFQEYRRYTFSHKAELCHLRRPKIHLFINNRITIYNSQPVKAFRAISEENLIFLFDVYQEHQRKIECFTQQDQRQKDNIEAFKQQYLFNVYDFHSTAILCLRIGCPLGALPGKVEFRQADISVKVDKERVMGYLQCLKGLVKKL